MLRAMAKPRVRVGVIGCGLIAQVMHLPHLRELSEEFEIAALCDLSRGTLDQVADAYGVRRRPRDGRTCSESRSTPCSC